MKRVFNLLTLMVLLLISACGGTISSTSSMIVVTDKGHSSDKEDYWIEAYDPNNETKDEAFKIFVKEEMVWNLIIKGTEYFATYEKEGDNPMRLNAIEYPDKTLRKRDLKQLFH